MQLYVGALKRLDTIRLTGMTFTISKNSAKKLNKQLNTGIKHPKDVFSIPEL